MSVYIHTRIYICIYVHVCVYVYRYAYVYILFLIYLNTHLHIHVRLYVNMCVHVCVYVYMWVYMQKKHVCIYTYNIYIYTSSAFESLGVGLKDLQRSLWPNAETATGMTNIGQGSGRHWLQRSSRRGSPWRLHSMLYYAVLYYNKEIFKIFY